MTNQRRDPGDSPGSQPPEAPAGAPRPGLGPVRLVARLAILAALLGIGGHAPEWLLRRDYGADPRASWEELPRLAAQVRAFHRRHPDRPVILFLGPSTVWGMGTTPRHAIPAQFARLLRARYRTGPLSRAKVFNLSLPSSPAAGDYYTLRALADCASLAYVQVHYFFFAEERSKDLRPEVLAGLGQWPAARDRALLGGKWQAGGLGGPVLARLAPHWPLLRDRYALRRALTGDSRAPGAVAYEAYEDWLHRSGRERRAAAAQRARDARLVALTGRYAAAPWEGIPRPLQEWFLHAFASGYDYPPLQADNANLVFCRRLGAYAAARRLPLVLYTAPINTEVLCARTRFDPARYRRNCRLIRRTLDRTGACVLAYDQVRLPPRYFHDASHLVDEGAAWQARRLLHDSAPVLARLQAAGPP